MLLPKPISQLASSTSIILGVLGLVLVLAEDPVVTLSHGGQLRGQRIDVNGTPVDGFFGEWRVILLNTLKVHYPTVV